MPELPEVQTIVSDLSKTIIGFRAADFWSDWEKRVKQPINQFKKNIKNQKIISLSRFGKHIVIGLENDYSIIIHLKMTGHLLFKRKNSKNKYFQDQVNQYIHHIFYLKKGSQIANLEFSDLRKFGWIDLVKTNEVKNLACINQLGTDAVSQDFSLKKFCSILKKHPQKKIGTLLLEQNLISGIGNIYRSEILFLAGVMPERIVATLSEGEIKQIHKFIKKVLLLAIKMRGTSDSDYRDASGAPGNFQKVLKVYRRAGEKCKKCNAKISRIKIGQRSAFYCQNCQK